MHDMGDAVHHDFERNRDLLLDLFRRNPRPLSDNFDVVVGYVGISLNGKVTEGDDASCEKQEGEAQNQPAVAESKIDDSADHYCSTVFCSTRALETTWSPGLIPETTSCMLPGSILPVTTSRRLKCPAPIGA